MAVVAIGAAAYVRCMFTRRRDAVVAGTAGAQDLGVIDRRRRYEGDGAVAVLANAGCPDVRWALPRRGRAVMAAHAVSSNARMVENSREPGAHGMAVVALIVG